MAKQIKKTIIAMSGGVDSSVAAALLVKENIPVVGVMLELWSDPSTENLGCTPDSVSLAKQVASQLDIPFHTINAQKLFREKVVDTFIEAHKRGETPNPCIICNKEVRWEILQSFAENIGAWHIATGHYARLRKDHFGLIQLLRGLDLQKDQSYVLYRLNQEILSRTRFPLGDYQKSKIREIARELSLPVAERNDSQDLCFVGNQGYRDFLTRYAPEIVKPGSILSLNGDVVGEHQGLAFYTIGQRKGLGISAYQPYYVLKKDLHRNTITVGMKDDLGQDETIVDQINWISGNPPNKPLRATIKIRYKAREVQGWIQQLDPNRVSVKFDTHLRDITPGQSAVFFLGEICIGGGIII